MRVTCSLAGITTPPAMEALRWSFMVILMHGILNAVRQPIHHVKQWSLEIFPERCSELQNYLVIIFQFTIHKCNYKN
jgi:hypothetical protein